MPGERFSYWNDSKNPVTVRTPNGFALNVPPNKVLTTYMQDGKASAFLTYPNTRRYAGDPAIVSLPGGQESPYYPHYQSAPPEHTTIMNDTRTYSTKDHGR